MTDEHKPCTGQHPDTDRVDLLMDLFRLRDREALDVWLDGGASLFESEIDDSNLQWDDGAYRVKTEEDREAQRAAAAEQRRRFEAGEMEPGEGLIYQVMQLYVKQVEDWLYAR